MVLHTASARMGGGTPVMVKHTVLRAAMPAEYLPLNKHSLLCSWFSISSRNIPLSMFSDFSPSGICCAAVSSSMACRCHITFTHSWHSSPFKVNVRPDPFSPGTLLHSPPDPQSYCLPSSWLSSDLPLQPLTSKQEFIIIIILSFCAG